MREENTETRASRSNNLTTHKSTCNACCLQFQLNSMNSDEDMCYSYLGTTQQLSQQRDDSLESIELTADIEKSNEPSGSIARNFDDGHSSTSTSDLMNLEDNIKIKHK